MKNKSTLKFCIFFLSCCFSLLVNAQQNSNSKNDLFQLEINKYSAELDFKKPRYHILSLQNNSNKELTFNISTIVNDSNNKIDKNNQNLSVEILDNYSNKSLTSITLKSKESIKFKIKIVFLPSARLGSMNICKIIAQLSNSYEEETVIISAYIPDPNSSGH